MNRHLTVAQLAELYCVGETTVLAWVRSGEMRAVNVSRNRSGRRPTYRISEDALADFERSRATREAAPAPPKKRRKDTDVTQFYS